MVFVLSLAACGDAQPGSSEKSSSKVNEISVELASASNGQDAFQVNLELLQKFDSEGEWFADPIGDLVTGSAGVILDAASEYPSGCAIWWYDSRSNLTNGVLPNQASFFWTPHYFAWELPKGPAVILLANSPNDRCVDGFLGASGLDPNASFELYDPTFSEGLSPSESQDTNADSQDTNSEDEFASQPISWEPDFHFTQWGDFESYIAGCSTFACGNVQIKIEYNPPTEYQDIDVTIFSQDKLVGRVRAFVEPGDVSSLLELEVTGIENGGENQFSVEVYDTYSDNLLATEGLVISVEMSPVEKLFAQNAESFANWASGGNKVLTDPYSLAEELINVGICDSVSDDGSRVRCSGSGGTGFAPGYDAYIYSRAADIVSLTQGYTYDNTVFYSSKWAISIYYPGWTASDTDIVTRMDALKWTVIGQDWRDEASCIGSCYVSRK
jgi:hypothetical protein